MTNGFPSQRANEDGKHFHVAIMFQNWCLSATAQIAKTEEDVMASPGSAYVSEITSETIARYVSKYSTASNTLRPRQNGRQFPDYILKCIFLNVDL